MERIELNDAFLNVGLPHLTDKNDFSKDDIKIIIEQVKDFSDYYGDSFINHKTCKTLKEFIKNYCVANGWYSLII